MWLKTPVGRLTADALFFVSLLVAPWWWSLILGLVFLALFDNYYELIVGAFVIDVLYGKDFLFHGQLISFTTTGLALLFLILSKPIKKRLIFYES